MHVRFGERVRETDGGNAARRPYPTQPVVPTLFGFWVPWLPFALTQRWPFGAWVAVGLDHFSRDAVARGVFEKQPSTDYVTALLDRAIRDSGVVPKVSARRGPC